MFSQKERMPDHAMSDADEFLHQAPDPIPERWQENMFFVGWNLEEGHGFLIHTRRWPHKKDHEAHIAIFVDGQPVSVILHRPTGPSARINDEIPELFAEAEAPWRRWRITAEIEGPSGFGPMGFVAHAPSGPETASVNLVLESELIPTDFNAALAEWDTDLKEAGSTQHNSAQAHYEQGGRWYGELRIGDRAVKSEGLWVRDHSWGERVEANFDNGVFWTASTLDGGHMFCNAIGFPQLDGTTVGTGIVVDQSGAYMTRGVKATFSPAPGLLTYDRTLVEYDFTAPLSISARTKVHVPKYLAGSGARRFDNNAISWLESNGRKGMGVMEWAAVLSPEDAAVLDECATGSLARD